MNTKKILSNLIPAIPVAIILGTMLFSPSCANTTTPPSGGPKDTIPPVITAVEPFMGAVNVPTHKTKLYLKFNEYVQVKDAKSLYLSPPLEKAPKYRLKGKGVEITFESDLDSNKTYTLDLTNAIADNNEGNMFPGYTLVFSTGDKVDSMVVTGLVQDCNTLQPLKGATVMLYKDHADSAVFLKRPDAAVKTDEWGFFCLRNVQDTIYRLYAIIDENNNNKYDPETEKVAFIDTLIKPVMMVSDSLPELIKYDMKDTVNCLARKQEYELSIFREKPSKQMIVNKERIGDRTAYITFMAPYAQIDSIWIKGIPKEKLITQFNIIRDSLEIWVNDPKPQPDTFYLNVKYLKTDSLGLLNPTVDEFKLINPNKKTFGKSSTKDIKHEDTIAVMNINAKPENIEQYGFEIEFKYPIVEETFDSLKFTSINPKQQETDGRYTITQDTLNLRKYTIKPTEKLQAGYEYKLKIPHRIFKDINGFYNDSTEVKVSLPNDDKLSTMFLKLTNVNNKYIVDLLDEKRTETLRSFIVDKDQTLTFPYIKAGKYSIRITEDVNRNGIVDTGILLEHKQPEKVRFYKLQDGTFLIDIPEMTEMEQNIDVSEMFK
ncbi:MAG: Ig-like domain-containing protein [Bacteroidales bacterium]|nr:Ig-like domain-containing protein [Bacteroidales bacterium]